MYSSLVTNKKLNVKFASDFDFDPSFDFFQGEVHVFSGGGSEK